MKNPVGGEFLESKYWGSKEFREAVEQSAGEAGIAQKPGEKISNYLERLERITATKSSRTGGQSRVFLKKSLYPQYIIKPKNISDDYIKGILLGNFAEQLGYERGDLRNEEVRHRVLSQFRQRTGDDFASYPIPEEERERLRITVVTDQKARMDRWYTYLTGAQTRGVPPAFRYWAFAEMLKLGSFNEERKVFNKRTENTAASFPELNQQALALVFDEIQRRSTGEPSQFQAGDETRQAQFRTLLQTEDFGKLYAFTLAHVSSLRLPTERLIITKGEWRRFPKGTPASELTTPIDGFNTTWCIAGEGYARDYLSRSDVWIYFSEDADGKNSIPRACIVDSGAQGITEVRGIMSSTEAKQHLDSYITPVVAKKLTSMPGGGKWQSTMEDMKHLAKTHFRHLQNEPLTKDDLVFLYEIHKSIQSSGYDRDPRIAEMLKRRDPEKDAPVVFGCAPEEIAWSQEAITAKTKAYVGLLFKGIFNTSGHFEHIYTSFPEGRVGQKTIAVGGKSTIELQSELAKRKEENIKTPKNALSMMQRKEFEQRRLKTKESANLVTLTVASLGFPNGATTREIYIRAQEFGLALCSPDVGPELRLQYNEQPEGEYLYIGMEYLPGPDGHPGVFGVSRVGGVSWLDSDWTGPDSHWRPARRFVFRKLALDSLKPVSSS